MIYNFKFFYFSMRHLGEMKYSCELCDYKCLRPYELEMHKRDHTGERPFNCNICSYR